MKKYVYRYCIYKNNVRDGVRFVASFYDLTNALAARRDIENARGGACDVVKKRCNARDGLPINNNISNNYKYRAREV